MLGKTGASQWGAVAGAGVPAEELALNKGHEANLPAECESVRSVRYEKRGFAPDDNRHMVKYAPRK